MQVRHYNQTIWRDARPTFNSGLLVDDLVAIKRSNQWVPEPQPKGALYS
jgi:hypothetical protein